MDNYEKRLLENKINTLENKTFRLEGEIFRWRMFRKEVESFLQMETTFGKNREEEYKKLRDEIELIKYY